LHWVKKLDSPDSLVEMPDCSLRPQVRDTGASYELRDVLYHPEQMSVMPSTVFSIESGVDWFSNHSLFSSLLFLFGFFF